jgi:hypothetical protein
MEIDFNEIQLAASVSPQSLGRKMQDIIAKAAEGDTPYLSDCISEMLDGGGYLLEALGDYYDNFERDMAIEDRITYKLFVIRDQWGEEVKPGDTVKVRILKNFRGVDGKIVSKTKQNAMKMQGTFDKAFHRFKEFKVDDKGCITCDHESAMRFLTISGVHGKSGIQITTKPEISEEPVDYIDKSGKRNGKKHVWYHLYKEVSPKYENNSGKKKNKYR